MTGSHHHFPVVFADAHDLVFANAPVAVGQGGKHPAEAAEASATDGYRLVVPAGAVIEAERLVGSCASAVACQHPA
ncbi:hypothetical protein D9M68_791960 [compost metagenome]